MSSIGSPVCDFLVGLEGKQRVQEACHQVKMFTEHMLEGQVGFGIQVSHGCSFVYVCWAICGKYTFFCDYSVLFSFFSYFCIWKERVLSFHTY